MQRQTSDVVQLRQVFPAGRSNLSHTQPESQLVSCARPLLSARRRAEHGVKLADAPTNLRRRQCHPSPPPINAIGTAIPAKTTAKSKETSPQSRSEPSERRSWRYDARANSQVAILPNTFALQCPRSRERPSQCDQSLFGPQPHWPRQTMFGVVRHEESE